MGKPTGFIEYERELPTDLPPEERILHWKEFHRPFPEEKLQTQGARCMDCGIPFCHTGQNNERNGFRLPDQQPDPRVE